MFGWVNAAAFAGIIQRWRGLERSMVRGVLAGCAWLAFLAGLAAACIFGVPRLQAFTVAQTVTREVRVEFVDPPLWFRDDLAAVITRTAEVQLAGSDALDREALINTRAVLLESGWFDAIAQVRRVANDRVLVEARFARPHAVVRDDAGDHLVDPAARLLPKSYPRGARTPFPVLSGVQFARPAQAGMRWEGEDVAAGLRLLRLLDEQPWRGQVVEVNVQDYLRDEPMRLVTDRGSTVVWGSAPGAEAALELLAPEKLKRLSLLHAKFGRIDGNHRGELDITT